MKSLEVIGANDTAMAAVIMYESYQRILDPQTRPAEMGRRPRSSFEVATLPICFSASDIVTRVAHDMGVYATRELHRQHGITNFSPPDTKPAEIDLIMCLTWGQYVCPREFEEVVHANGIEANPGYFGSRIEIMPRLHIKPMWYIPNYGEDSVLSRQVTYSSRPNSNRKKWLDTTVDELISGEYPIGEVEPDSYPTSKWAIH